MIAPYSLFINRKLTTDCRFQNTSQQKLSACPSNETFHCPKILCENLVKIYFLSSFYYNKHKQALRS